MKLLLLSLIFLTSCNIAKTLENGETKIPEDFDDNECTSCDNNQNIDMTSGLASFWNFNTYSSGYTGNSSTNNMGAQGGLTDPSVAGKVQNALNCNATSNSNYLRTISASGFNFGTTQDFTIAFWTKRASQATASPVFFYVDTSNADIILSQGASSSSINVNVGGRGYTATNVFSNNNWVHVALRFDRDVGMQSCINGNCSAYSGIASTGDDINGASNIYFCVNSSLGSTTLDAAFDSFGVWDRILSDDEISALKNGNNNLD